MSIFQGFKPYNFTHMALIDVLRLYNCTVLRSFQVNIHEINYSSVVFYLKWEKHLLSTPKYSLHDSSHFISSSSSNSVRSWIFHGYIKIPKRTQATIESWVHINSSIKMVDAATYWFSCTFTAVLLEFVLLHASLIVLWSFMFTVWDVEVRGNSTVKLDFVLLLTSSIVSGSFVCIVSGITERENAAKRAKVPKMTNGTVSLVYLP